MAHHCKFFSATAIAKVQLILRSCGSGVGDVAGFAPNSNFQQTFRCQPRVAPCSSPCKFFGGCNLLDFAELRMRSCGVGGVERNAARSSAWQALHISLTFRLAPRSPPCNFCSECDCECAIDFAVLRIEAKLEAWQALHLNQTFSCGHIATHHAAFFCECILQGAIDFAEWRMRSCGRGAEWNAARSSAWPALHLSLRRIWKTQPKRKVMDFFYLQDAIRHCKKDTQVIYILSSIQKSGGKRGVRSVS